MPTYKVFKRSCRNFDEMVTARKITVRKGVPTVEMARAICREFNDSRTPAQIRNGTKLEFTQE